SHANRKKLRRPAKNSRAGARESADGNGSKGLPWTDNGWPSCTRALRSQVGRPRGMDPRDRADALLARAQARGAFVVTPDNATSPMDAANTQQIPRSVVDKIDRGEDPDTTAVVPSAVIDSVQGKLLDTKPDTRVDLRPVRPEPEEQQVEGLIPTTTQSTGRSDLSRRLEGL